MKKLLVLSTLFASGVALAQPTVGVAVANSSDSDGAKTRANVVSTGFQLNDYVGIGYSYSDLSFSSSGWRASGHRHGVQGTYRDSIFSVTADVGQTTVRNKSTVTGSVSGEAWVSDSFMLLGGIERELVDNETGITNGITYSNYYVGGDYVRGMFGVSAVVGSTHFSDDNRRTYTRVKVYHEIADGVHVYVRNWNYSNSRPYQGNYYAPSNYNQALAGVGFRQAFGPGVVSGHIDFGRQRADGNSEPSRTWRVAYDVPVGNSGWAATAYISEDQNQPGYTYRTNGVAVSYRF